MTHPVRGPRSKRGRKPGFDFSGEINGCNDALIAADVKAMQREETKANQPPSPTMFGKSGASFDSSQGASLSQLSTPITEGVRMKIR